MSESFFDTEKDQVFLMVCPANFPFSFAVHPWFVVNRKGILSRWEVTARARKRELSWGHLNKNLYLPTQGIEVFPFSERPFWKKGRVLKIVEGGMAVRMGEFIEQSNTEYPERNGYKLRGPNSNSYAQWVIDRFPEVELNLPWNAFGKGYPHKTT